MSDAVYETKDGTFAATRFWGGQREDCVQLTLSGHSRTNGYGVLTLDEFRQMYQAIEKNVEDTKGAWWHGINKEVPMKGLYNKYIIQKANGKPLDPDFFAIVLRIDSGRYLHACRAGVAAFAEAVHEHNPILANDLRKKLEELGT